MGNAAPGRYGVSDAGSSRWIIACAERASGGQVVQGIDSYQSSHQLFRDPRFLEKPVNKKSLTLVNNPSMYMTRSSFGRKPAANLRRKPREFNADEQRDRLECAVIDIRGYIQFGSAGRNKLPGA